MKNKSINLGKRNQKKSVASKLFINITVKDMSNLSNMSKDEVLNIVVKSTGKTSIDVIIKPVQSKSTEETCREAHRYLGKKPRR